MPVAARTSSRVTALTPRTYIRSAADEIIRARVASPRAVIRRRVGPSPLVTGATLPAEPGSSSLLGLPRRRVENPAGRRDARPLWG